MPGLSRSFLLVLVAGCSFALVSTVIRDAVPWPAGFGIREKLEAFEKIKDECDVAYFGSSYVYRSFRPEIIDAELAARGVDVTSFNFGIGGMDAFEADYLMREVIAMHPADLRWIFMEPRPFFGAISTSPNAFTERSLRWHTAWATWQAFRSVWLSTYSTQQKLDDTWVHLQLFVRRLGNYGLGRTLVSDWLGLDEPFVHAEAFVGSRGYMPLDGVDVPSFRQRRRALLSNPEGYEDEVAALDGKNSRAMNMSTVNIEAFQVQADAVRASGATPFSVLPPGLIASPVVSALGEAGEIPFIYRFNSPRRYPELYEIDMRFDRGHLNREGAVLFSKFFADAIAPRLVENN